MPLAQTMIMIVSNDRNRAEWCGILSGDYKIVYAADRSQVFAELDRQGGEVAAVIVSLDLPGMDGYNIVEELGKAHSGRRIPVLAVKDSGSQEEEAGVLALGAWDYMEAPLLPRILKARLKNMIRLNTGLETDTDCREEDFWHIHNRKLEILLSRMPQMSGICVCENGGIRVMYGSEAIRRLLEEQKETLENVCESDREDIRSVFLSAVHTRESVKLEFEYSYDNKVNRWFRIQFDYLDQIKEGAVVLCSLCDITFLKEMERELHKYKSAIFRSDAFSNKILIVDDQEMNRVILKEIFKDHYNVLEAANGLEAIEVLEQNHNDVDVILLDLMMPVMDGEEFLEYKKKHSEIADIPVVVITADSSHNQQVNILALGADDYIVKPFVLEVVLRRINNVLESHRRFREMLREYNSMAEQAKEDPLTRLYNRSAGEEHIAKVLKAEPERTHALIMLDVDHFKSINDTYGHKFGDDILRAVAGKIKEFFRDTDVVSRFGGDEFCIFMRSVSKEDMAYNKCLQLCRQIGAMEVGEKKVTVSVSIGIAVSSNTVNAFDTLYKNADKALYESKYSGRNRVTMYSVS